MGHGGLLALIFHLAISYLTAFLTLGDPIEACMDAAARRNPMLVKVAQAAAGYSRAFSPGLRRVLRKYVDKVPWRLSEIVPFRERLAAVADSAGYQLECGQEPVASGTTAVVYRGTLGEHEVAIKVLRRGAAARVASAVDTIRTLVSYATALGWSHGDDVTLFLDANNEVLLEQCDLVREARNTGRFRSMLSSIDGVSVPLVYEEFSAAHPDVLVSEWASGRPLGPGVISSASDKLRAADALTNVQIRSIMIEGFFHADLHPGNVMYDANKREIWLLDCGIMGTADPLEIECIIRSLGSLTGDGKMPSRDDIETIASVLTKANRGSGRGLKKTVLGLRCAIKEGRRALSEIDPEVALALYRNLQKSGCRPVPSLYRVLLSYASNHGLLTSLVGSEAQVELMSQKMRTLQDTIEAGDDEGIDVVTASDSD